MIYQLPAFTRAFRKLPAPAQTAATAAIARLETAFGRPHLHLGSGIRPFGRYFELRAGQELRILFLVEGGDFFPVALGHHNHVRAYLKNNG